VCKVVACNAGAYRAVAYRAAAYRVAVYNVAVCNVAAYKAAGRVRADLTWVRPLWGRLPRNHVDALWHARLSILRLATIMNRA